MFKTKREWWDVLCDISTGEMFVSAPVEKEEYDVLDRNFVLEVCQLILYNEYTFDGSFGSHRYWTE